MIVYRFMFWRDGVRDWDAIIARNEWDARQQLLDLYPDASQIRLLSE